MRKLRLPIGIQSFEKLRTNHYLYIDKTQHIYRLIEEGEYYFLSRPRRFGKSLMLSTIAALFKGQKELFKDLWIEDQWDWTETYPVIHLSLNSIDYRDLDLNQALQAELRMIAKRYSIELEEDTTTRQFKELIYKLSTSKGKVILLIDEYDKPIIDYLSQDKKHIAFEHQAILKGFYSVIKDSDPYIRFLLITGISKFSKVSFLSNLNNLADITLHRKFAALTGYTQAELDHYFQPYRPKALAYTEMDEETLSKNIKEWYNGYSWDGETFVYNPWSILRFFSEGAFRNYWFATGTPTFLVELMKERFEYNVEEGLYITDAFDNYDINYLETTPLLFQTGYLTIKSIDKTTGLYFLAYPNKEVKKSLLQYLLGAFRYSGISESGTVMLQLREAFLEENYSQIISIINSLFNRIPYQIFIAKKEAYYHSILFLIFQFLDFFNQAEVNTSNGRIDAVVETPTTIFILEFKLDQSADEAIQQIRDKGYANAHRHKGKKLIGLGINFDSQSKQVENWKKVSL